METSTPKSETSSTAKDNLIKSIREKNSDISDGITEDALQRHLSAIVDKYCMFIKGNVAKNDASLILFMQEVRDRVPNDSGMDLDWGHFKVLLDFAKQKLKILGRGKVVEFGDLTDELFEFYKNGYNSGLRIPGWYVFSDMFKIARGELNVVTGVPGHGKSEFLDALMIKLAQHHQMKFGVFSPENYPYALHAEKLISKKLNKPFHDGPTPRMSEEEMTSGLAWVHDHFFIAQPSEDDLSLDAVLGLFDIMIKKHKIDGVVIDPWNEIDQNRTKDSSETDYIKESLTKMRRFARNRNVMLWIIAHPAKQYKDKSGERKTVTPYDIAGSGHWYNRADNCFTVERCASNEVKVHIQKVKFKVRGRTGVAEFDYDKATGNYKELTSATKKSRELPKV